MTRLAALILTLLCLAFPTGIAYGACNSNVALDQELDQGTTAALLVSVENPAECRQDAGFVRTAATSTRQYDPSTGRFTSRDPLEDVTGQPYAYAYNNPLVYTDPSGEIPQWMKSAGGYVGDKAKSAGSWAMDHTVESDAAYWYAGKVWGNDTVNGAFETVNKFNPAVGLLTHADQCSDGSWEGATLGSEAGASKPRSDAAMVAAEQGDGNHCWKAAGHGAMTVGTALGLQTVGATAWGMRGGQSIALGSYPGYIALGKETGARTFNIPGRAWHLLDKLPGNLTWRLNQRFLDKAVARNSDILRSQSASSAKAGTTFAKELAHLQSRGYRPSADGMRMVPR